MENALKEILKKLDSLTQGQQELGQNYQSLAQGQEELRNNFGVLAQGQEELRNNFGTLAQGQEELKTGVQKLEKKVDNLELRMEEEVFNKIGALFNGHSLRGNQIDNLREYLDERFDRIEADTRYLVTRVAKLERLVK